MMDYYSSYIGSAPFMLTRTRATPMIDYYSPYTGSVSLGLTIDFYSIPVAHGWINLFLPSKSQL